MPAPLLRTFVHPREEAVLLEGALHELQLPPAAVRMLEALRSVNEAHPQQLLGQLGRLRPRFDGRVLGELALVAWSEQRIHELAALEVLDTLRVCSRRERAYI